MLPPGSHRPVRARIRAYGSSGSGLLRAASVIDPWLGKRKPFLQTLELLPKQTAFTIATGEPFAPRTSHLVAEVAKHTAVAGHTVVGVVAPDLLTQLLPLLLYRPMPAVTTPLVDRPDGSSQPLRHRPWVGTRFTWTPDWSLRRIQHMSNTTDTKVAPTSERGRSGEFSVDWVERNVNWER